MQACFGVVMAGEIALDAYVVQLVPESMCVRAVAVSSAAAHMGYVLAAEGGELALATGASYESLFWLSLVTILLASILTLALPKPLQAMQPLAPQQVSSPDKLVNCWHCLVDAAYAACGCTSGC